MPKKGEAKRGKFGKVETDFIREKVGTMTVEAIAKALNRTVPTVKKYIEDNVLDEAPDQKSLIKQELRSTVAWQQLKDEFDSKELAYFEEKYIRYTGQFKEDVLETEDTQIFLVIKLEIMMHRNVVSKRRAKIDIARLVKMQEQLESKYVSIEDMDESTMKFALDLEGQIQSARSAEASKTAEFIRLEEKHQALMKDLKATRDQRVNRIESSKISWLGVLKQLQEEEHRDRVGRQMELMKKVTSKELARLGSPTKYEDGAVDLPILSADTIESQHADAKD